MKKIIFGALSWVSALASVYAQPDTKKLEAYLSQVQKDWGVPSMSVAVVKDGKIVFSKGFGKLEEGKKEEADGNTLYAIASNSKAFTSTIIAMLVQEKKLSWNDKVQKHLPYFELYDSWVSKEMTIADLLSHRSGLGTFSGDFIWYKSSLTPEEILLRTKYLPKAFGFRDGYGYSNLMYIAAGEVIQKVTGKTWAVNVQERIFKPLGMDRTITSLQKLEEKGNYASPHALKDGKNIPIRWENWENVGALGGVISSPNDLAKWVAFNTNRGIVGNDTLLRPSAFANLWRPHNNFAVNMGKPNDFNNRFSGYALGWGVSDYHGNLKISHTGGYDGMLTAVSILPDQKLGVIVLTNGMNSPMMPVSNYLMEAYLGLPEKDWSKIALEKKKDPANGDKRIANIKAAKLENTQPSLPLEKYAGDYFSDIYGNISVGLENGALRLSFEHTPELSATLKHWHHDVWEIAWDKEHAWFSFGTLKFDMDNNLKIKGMSFDVPNDDIFFEELKPRKK